MCYLLQVHTNLTHGDPPGIGRWETLQQMRRHDFNFVQVYQTLKDRFGDVFSLYLPSRRYVVNHPDQLRHVLKDRQQNYIKSADYKELKPMLGEGLLNSEGELWKKQRRLISGEFTNERARQQGSMIATAAENLLRQWEKRGGQSFDLAADMMALTFEIAGKAFFGSELGPHSAEVGAAFSEAGEASTLRMISLFKLPMAFPTPVNVKYRRAVKTLDRIVYAIIKERQRSGGDRVDLLSRLLAVSQAEGSHLSPRLLRDELITFMIAGHETTSLALTWTWYLLARYPEIHQKLRAELDEVLKGKLPTAADLPQLNYTRMVIQESLRLYPPAAALSRQPVEDDSVGGFRIRAGSLLSCVPAIVHRDARFWDRPDEFVPERFDGKKPLVPFSYMPFGAGPRICVGEQFAMLEAQLILATLAARFVFRLDPERKVVPHPFVTLRPKHGLWGRLETLS